MLLEIEEETRDFKTAYNSDYPAKQCSRVKKILPTPNYKYPSNTINGPFIEYLTGIEEKIISWDEEKVQLKGISFKDFIEEEKRKSLRTNYQDNYCVLHSKYMKDSIKEKCVVSLPDNVIIPETTYKKSYRELGQYLDILENRKTYHVIEKPEDNLKPDFKAREILRVKTGDTEYSSVIGAPRTNIEERNNETA